MARLGGARCGESHWNGSAGLAWSRRFGVARNVASVRCDQMGSVALEGFGWVCRDDRDWLDLSHGVRLVSGWVVALEGLGSVYRIDYTVMSCDYLV